MLKLLAFSHQFSLQFLGLELEGINLVEELLKALNAEEHHHADPTDSERHINLDEYLREFLDFIILVTIITPGLSSLMLF